MSYTYTSSIYTSSHADVDLYYTAYSQTKREILLICLKKKNPTAFQSHIPVALPYSKNKQIKLLLL